MSTTRGRGVTIGVSAGQCLVSTWILYLTPEQAGTHSAGTGNTSYCLVSRRTSLTVNSRHLASRSNLTSPTLQWFLSVSTSRWQYLPPKVHVRGIHIRIAVLPSAISLWIRALRYSTCCSLRCAAMPEALARGRQGQAGSGRGTACSCSCPSRSHRTSSDHPSAAGLALPRTLFNEHCGQ